MIGANLRFGNLAINNQTTNVTRVFHCHPDADTESAVLFTISCLGIASNCLVMLLILTNKPLRRWSQGLLFHQALIDCTRAALLLPMAVSILRCQPVHKCSLLETAFLLLVTVTTVNLLTSVLNDAPVLPEESDSTVVTPTLLDSPQCMLFAFAMIWFASVTINLGPTFLSGALAANTDHLPSSPGCPLVYGPFRHYILNVLWIAINLLCVMLTIIHLHKLRRDLTQARLEAVRVAGLIATMLGVSARNPQLQANRSSSKQSLRAQSDPKLYPYETKSPYGKGKADQTRRLARPGHVDHHIRRMEIEGYQRVRMFAVLTIAYIICWGPLYIVTLLTPVGGGGPAHEFTLHLSCVHSFANAIVLVALHRGLRLAIFHALCTWTICTPPMHLESSPHLISSQSFESSAAEREREKRYQSRQATPAQSRAATPPRATPRRYSPHTSHHSIARFNQESDEEDMISRAHDLDVPEPPSPPIMMARGYL